MTKNKNQIERTATLTCSSKSKANSPNHPTNSSFGKDFSPPPFVAKMVDRRCHLYTLGREVRHMSYLYAALGRETDLSHKTCHLPINPAFRSNSLDLQQFSLPLFLFLFLFTFFFFFCGGRYNDTRVRLR